MKEKEFLRNTSEKKSKREIENSQIAKRAAEEGIVLLKNNDILPIRETKNIALYGAGARKTVKGGLGSGEVNERKSITIEEGLINKGYKITTKKWIEDYDKIYVDAKNVWNKAYSEFKQEDPNRALIDTIAFTMPAGRLITDKDIKDSKTDTAIYVISRIAGEGADRKNKKGDYQLFDIEKQNIEIIAKSYKNTIVVINSGSCMDISFLDEIPQVGSVLYMLQAGTEGGTAFANIISGKVSPSGKLTDTLTNNYEDYPNSETFGDNDDDTDKERYYEGIYVGYRYFDSAGLKPKFEFGYGLSYTSFEIETRNVSIDGSKITCRINVKNIGKQYSGKEVVQIYMSAPQGKLKKEYQRLVAFEKTKELAPGESQELQIKFDISEMKSYDVTLAEWILEKGIYKLRIGNSSRNNNVEAYIELNNKIVIEKNTNICELEEDLIEIQLNPIEEQRVNGIPKLTLNDKEIQTKNISYKTIKTECAEIKEIIDKLTKEELCYLVCGEYIENTEEVIWRDPTIPGTAGETTTKLKDKYNIQNIILSDGPAGLRMKNKYQLNGKTYYQYCTAFPSATVLAQTWNTELVKEVGVAVGKEMEEFGVTLWLAPGMNIHRNPLCGRNFEYYSEDPFVSGIMAASLTLGVQSNPGVGTTIKHIACNNQESNRISANSIVSERALREIYLRGFEIAVKLSNPMSVMTSYNMINGVIPANSTEICTKVLRNEWGFKGVVMTDWSVATLGTAITWKCMVAGNDLIMPGNLSNINNLLQALENNELKIDDLKKCAGNVLKIILCSNRYEGSKSYYEYLKINT